VEAFDPRSALVVVDVQNDFADPAGSLAVRGGADIVPLVNEAVAAAEAGGALVAYTQDWHPPHTPHFAPDGGIWPVHCVAGSWGAELHPELDIRGPRVRKGQHGEDGYSGFTMRDAVTGETQPTELEGLLRERGVTRVAVCGLATDYCVFYSAIDARAAGFDTRVLLEASRGIDRDGSIDRALAAMRDAGVELVAR
jgi:nicotinamidase/pyrazinamidase